MVDDVVLDKAAGIERCLGRVREACGADGTELAVDQRRQDALVLNLLRACETAIDLAMHVVRVRGLGVPWSSRHAFALLADAQLLDDEVAEELQRMVGFRDVAVHRFRDPDLAVVHAIVREKSRVFARLVRGDGSPRHVMPWAQFGTADVRSSRVAARPCG
jgi:uncharacterized protein YutE (UPF0331/DUF86 family)